MKVRRPILRLLALAFLPLLPGVLTAHVQAQTITVVNMIPPALNNESNQDSEPDITVNPNNAREIIGTAFTPNPTGSTATAPIFISQDGGATWVLNNIVPSGNGMTGDITVALSRNNVLYAGILRGGSGLDMRILRSSTYTTASAMTQLLGRTNEDQPYTRAYSPLGGPLTSNDHLYVGHNDLGNMPQTASLEQSLDSATAAPPAGLTTIRLEQRTPFNQDGPPIRPTVHGDGTVYGIYLQRTASSGTIRTGNVVVVRDDDFGQGATPYSDLVDPSDMVAGRFVVSGINWVFQNSSVFGQERLGDRASIAVDPTDSQIVYVAWADLPAGVMAPNSTLHVSRSIDGGNNWSGDLLTINGAIVPQLAVNIRGDVGFLYQQLTGTGASQQWQTHFQQSTNGGSSWTDFILADTPANNPAVVFLPYLGDYAGLTAVGKDFYGVFSASNIPNNANFPNGVTYQRSADFSTQTLNDGMGGAVAVSIDPFFFRVQNQTDANDFYVRDWTDSSSSNDQGLEPSTHAVFYSTSDVWNRRSNTAGGFDANDRPISEDPTPFFLGDNFAFARVHRKSTGSAATVTLHFLKSEFGTGSNYQNAAAAADPTLSFAAADQVQTMSSGYQWTLTAATSNHTCLAVEISTPEDPFVPPSLLGRAPGWPDTDLAVIYDNNKAQRNMGVYAVASDGSQITYWALIHNAATYFRNISIQLDPDERYVRLFRETNVNVVGDGTFRRDGNRLILLGMAPGENRWIGLTTPVSKSQQDGERALVSFSELRGQQPINGFAIAVEGASIKKAATENLILFSTNLHRLGTMRNLQDAIDASEKVQQQLRDDNISPETYVTTLATLFPKYRDWIDAILMEESADPFDLKHKLDGLQSVIGSQNAEKIFPEQANVDHAVDALLTYIDKHQGDIADVAQNMRWQHELAGKLGSFVQVEGLKDLAIISAKFDTGYAARELSLDDYEVYVSQSIPILRRIDEALALGKADTLSEMENQKKDPRLLQKLHRLFLLAVHSAIPDVDEQTTDAPFIFLGTVAAEKKSVLLNLPASEETYVVNVESTYVQNGSFANQNGKQVTVVDPQRMLKNGEKYLFYTEPIMFGESIAVRLLKATAAQESQTIMAREFKQASERRALAKRVRATELIVLGTVVDVRPYETRTRIESEHLPELMRAIVKVDKVLKGELATNEVSFIFAGSIDVHWYKAPKFKQGDKGIFLLNKADANTMNKIGVEAEDYTLLEPLDVQPLDRQAQIEQLLE